MWPDRVSNPGPLTHESGALLTGIAARHPERCRVFMIIMVLPKVLVLVWLVGLGLCFLLFFYIWHLPLKELVLDYRKHF